MPVHRFRPDIDLIDLRKIEIAQQADVHVRIAVNEVAHGGFFIFRILIALAYNKERIPFFLREINPAVILLKQWKSQCVFLR